jgi:hypothetical protein
VHVVNQEENIQSSKSGDVIIEIQDIVIVLSIEGVTESGEGCITTCLNQSTKALSEVKREREREREIKEGERTFVPKTPKTNAAMKSRRMRNKTSEAPEGRKMKGD